MILFHSTKTVGTQTFMVFTNEAGAFIQVPVDHKVASLFVHHFERLSPGFKRVEDAQPEENLGK